MTRYAKASTEDSGTLSARIRSAFATRGASGNVTGSSAPSLALPRPALILTLLTLAGTLGLTAVSQAAALPDGRIVELVSTSGNFGEPYTPASPIGFTAVGVNISEHPFEAAETGDSVAYVGEPPAVGGTGEAGPGQGVQWLATRTPSGWTDAAITPSSRNANNVQIYQAFSSDLSAAFLEGGRQESLLAEVVTGCRALYSRTTVNGAYRALFVPEAPYPANQCGNPLFAGASEDGSQVIFQSEAALAEGAEESTELPPGRSERSFGGNALGESCAIACNLYDATGGHLRLVSSLEGHPVSNAVFGGYPGESGLPDFSNAISTDGSRIFWTDTQPGPDFEHVFVFENGTTNVPVSGSGAAEYWTATPDGRYAFYTEDGELWRFDTHSQTRATVTPAAYSATGTGNLTGPGAGSGTTTEGSNVITGVVTSSGTFAVGQTIEGVPGEGCGSGCIPAGAKITAVGSGTLTLSANATESGTNFGIAAGSDEVTSLTTTAGQFHEGEHIFGPGIQADTTIVAATATTLELSNSTTASGTGVALEAGGSEVQGVIGTNQAGGEEQDGAYLYFVADGVLAANENSEGETATAGQPNLYLTHEGTSTFIATLSPQDNEIAATSVGTLRGGDWKAGLGVRTAAVAPDGRHLVFESIRPLTGYENLIGEGKSVVEVFRYSNSDGETLLRLLRSNGGAPHCHPGTCEGD